MVSFSIAPTSKFHSHAIDRWRNDPELRSLMPWSRLGGQHVESARLCFRFVRMDELWVGVTATSSPLAYANVPASLRTVETERGFTLLMPNRPRLVEIGAKRYWQHAGECVLTDSEAPLVGTYTDPHAAICLNIPFETVRGWLPEMEGFEGLRLGNSSTSSRIVSLLLLSLWQSIDCGGDVLGSRRAADALLGVLALRCHRSSARHDPTEPHKKLDREQVRDYINSHIRDPQLSVQRVAERIGVTTRYLQLLFAEAGECVSEYIKRERLRGCLLDLRDLGFDCQSITEIAFSWGFNSAAHFSSSFRKEFGLSPRDYRNCDIDELPSSPVANVESQLVEALLVLGRSLHGTHTPPGSGARNHHPAIA